MMGLDNAGKTSIAKNVFENKTFQELKNLSPTQFLETHQYNYRQMINISIFDCGGQVQFLKEYRTDQFRIKVFNKVTIMIWVIDSSDKGKIRKSITEFTKNYVALQEYSPDAKIFILAHKNDKKKVELKEIKKIVNELVEPKIKIHYFSTSIKNNSAKLKIK